VVAEGQGSPGVAAVGLEGVRLGAELHELHGGSGSATLFLASFRSPWVGTTASLRLQLSVTIAYISRLLAALLGEQWRPPAQGQAASQQVVVPRNTHGSRAEQRGERRMNWRACWFGERRRLHLLASLLLLRVLVSLSATSYLESLTWG